MTRRCFLLRLKPERVEEYLQAHDVWPEMREALSAAGIRNYSLFIQKETGMMAGYFEADDPEAALASVGQTDVNRRWQEHMAEYFETGGDMDKGDIEFLPEYFHLP